MSDKKQQIILLHGSNEFTQEKAAELNLVKGELVIEHGDGYAKLHTQDNKSNLATFIDEKAINAITNPISSGLTDLQTGFEDHIDNVASESVEGHTKLVSGDVTDKVYTDGEAAAASHNHDNTYSKLNHKHVSDDITDAVSALTGCTESSAELVQGKVVYELKTQVEGISNNVDEINEHEITLVGGTDLSGTTKFKLGSTGATLNWEVKDYSHNHKSANIDDAISALTGCTVSSDQLVQGKVVKELETKLTGNLENHISEIASEDAEGHAKLVSGDVSNNVYADGEAAAASHNHDNTYSKLNHKHVSDDITDAVSALADCESGSTKLVEGNAVYELKTQVESNASSITTLIGTEEGDDTKSVRNIAAEEVAKIVNGADASYDTLKEIADWIQNDTTGAAKMANDIENLNKVTGGFTGENAIKNAIEDHIDNVASESVEGHTKLVSGDVSNKVYANGEAAAASHNHDNTYSKLNHKHVSDDITDAVSALADCTSGSTKLVEGNAVYELKTQVEGISEDYLNDIKVTSYNNTVTVSIDGHIATIDVTNMTIDGGEY